MSFAKIHSAQPGVLGAKIINVEIDLAKGLSSFTIVGLPDKAVEESKDRVSAAIKNNGFESPKQLNQKVVVSLAPADLKKEGPIFDLPIALAYLLAQGHLNFDPKDKIFIGELSLDGELRKISGTLSVVAAAQKAGYKEIFLPSDNAREASLVDGITIYGVKSLNEIINHFGGRRDAKNKPLVIALRACPHLTIETVDYETEIDFGDIKGQEGAKRGLVIAAAGGHNIAMYGPPGTGKTMLAKAFAGIMPPLTFDEILETTAIHSVAGALRGDYLTRPPIRSPHHTASYVSIVGGGAIPKPGEITLAHRGVLFLDEFPEFDRKVIETLRQPLEEGEINISRAKGTLSFPADFILVAAMNPCPCGHYGSKTKPCVCRPTDLLRYERKISGPIVDRVDLWTEVSVIDHASLSSTEKKAKTKQSTGYRDQVLAARALQATRFSGHPRKLKLNSQMSARDLEDLIQLKKEVKEILDLSATRLNLSARAYHRIIKLARTIADLAGRTEIETPHILEAIQYRPKR